MLLQMNVQSMLPLPHKIVNNELHLIFALVFIEVNELLCAGENEI